jgi:hypothetical protein
VEKQLECYQARREDIKNPWQDLYLWVVTCGISKEMDTHMPHQGLLAGLDVNQAKERDTHKMGSAATTHLGCKGTFRCKHTLIIFLTLLFVSLTSYLFTHDWQTLGKYSQMLTKVSSFILLALKFCKGFRFVSLKPYTFAHVWPMFHMFITYSYILFSPFINVSLIPYTFTYIQQTCFSALSYMTL